MNLENLINNLNDFINDHGNNNSHDNNDHNNNNINLYQCRDILNQYNGNDWTKYTKYCDNDYKRNLVYSNDKFKILILCWKSGQKAKIHDHPENGCLVKLLKGKLIEEIYKNNNGKIEYVKSKTIYVGDISYQQGKNGLHKIINPFGECAVSLHIYSPSNYKPFFYEK